MVASGALRSPLDHFFLLHFQFQFISLKFNALKFNSPEKLNIKKLKIRNAKHDFNNDSNSNRTKRISANVFHELRWSIYYSSRRPMTSQELFLGMSPLLPERSRKAPAPGAGALRRTRGGSRTSRSWTGCSATLLSRRCAGPPRSTASDRGAENLSPWNKIM